MPVKRRLITALALFTSLFFISRLQLTTAQQAVVINPQFDYVRQGTVGLITLSGADVVGGGLNVLGRTYPFFPTNQGYACLLAVPMDQKIQDYPMTITLIRRDGATATWQGTLKVAAGQFIVENPYTLPNDKIYLLSDDIQRNEDARLLAVYKMVTPARYWEGRFSFPVNGALTAPFGGVRTYNGLAVRQHTGQDMRANMATPVLASASGRVVFSRALDIHGESVIIDHGWGVFTEYSHLSQRFVVPGQFVLQGDILGLSGTTGRSTGPHLHFEVAVNDVWVSPAAFMELKLPN